MEVLPVYVFWNLESLETASASRPSRQWSRIYENSEFCKCAFRLVQIKNWWVSSSLFSVSWNIRKFFCKNESFESRLDVLTTSHSLFFRVKINYLLSVCAVYLSGSVQSTLLKKFSRIFRIVCRLHTPIAGLISFKMICGGDGDLEIFTIHEPQKIHGYTYIWKWISAKQTEAIRINFVI